MFKKEVWIFKSFVWLNRIDGQKPMQGGKIPTTVGKIFFHKVKNTSIP